MRTTFRGWTVAVATAVAAAVGPTAAAAQMQNGPGGERCFGIAGSCPDGAAWRTILGGTFAHDYRMVEGVVIHTFDLNPAWLPRADGAAFATTPDGRPTIEYAALAINVSAVPEPSTGLLVAGGLLGLGAVARSRRR